MPISLRIPPEKLEIINKAAEKAGTTKTAFVLSAIDEKLGVAKNREQMLREFAGWLTSEDADELRKAVDVFNQVHEEDWS